MPCRGQRAGQASGLPPWETVLPMNGDRVVRLGVNPVLQQVVEHPVAVGGIPRFNHIQMEHVAIAGANAG